MGSKYKVGRTPRHRGRKVIGVMALSLVLFAGGLGFVIFDANKNSDSGEVEGASVSVAQQADVAAANQQVTINDPLFSFDLTKEWKEVERKNTPIERSIMWAPRQNKTAIGHSLKLFVDVIPKDFAINKLLPLDAADNRLSYRQISENCKNYTPEKKDNNLPQPSKWQGVEFMCDLPSFAQNKVGTGSPGAMNTTTVQGETQGKHTYFFVYTDHNDKPDYQILYTALKTFQAK
jgi:hypothetical protein